MNAPQKSLVVPSFDWESADVDGLTVRMLMNRLLLGLTRATVKQLSQGHTELIR